MFSCLFCLSRVECNHFHLCMFPHPCIVARVMAHQGSRNRRVQQPLQWVRSSTQAMALTRVLFCTLSCACGIHAWRCPEKGLAFERRWPRGESCGPVFQSSVKCDCEVSTWTVTPAPQVRVLGHWVPVLILITACWGVAGEPPNPWAYHQCRRP